MATWELAQAAIPHTLVTDAAAGWLLQSGRIDVVLVGAEAIAQNGDVANDAGTYPVAALAGRTASRSSCARRSRPSIRRRPTAVPSVNDERPASEVPKFAKVPWTPADTPP